MYSVYLEKLEMPCSFIEAHFVCFELSINIEFS